MEKAVRRSRLRYEKLPRLDSGDSETGEGFTRTRKSLRTARSRPRGPRALRRTARQVRVAAKKGPELGDAGTADIFTEVSRGIDKWLWFVEAHLKARE